jgi:hypothetical protein
MRSICHHMDLEEDNYFKLHELNYTPTLPTENRFF